MESSKRVRSFSYYAALFFWHVLVMGCSLLLVYQMHRTFRLISTSLFLEFPFFLGWRVIAPIVLFELCIYITIIFQLYTSTIRGVLFIRLGIIIVICLLCSTEMLLQSRDLSNVLLVTGIIALQSFCFFGASRIIAFRLWSWLQLTLISWLWVLMFIMTKYFVAHLVLVIVFAELTRLATR
jgi:hypothetical protein